MISNETEFRGDPKELFPDGSTGYHSSVEVNKPPSFTVHFTSGRGRVRLTGYAIPSNADGKGWTVWISSEGSHWAMLEKQPWNYGPLKDFDEAYDEMQPPLQIPHLRLQIDPGRFAKTPVQIRWLELYGQYTH
jgi:hypothetical protein